MDFKKLIKIATLLSVLIVYPTLAANVFQADKYFEQKKYDLAYKKYSEASIIGSPHAYYQLGVMNYQGLGIKKDPIQAMVWFSLAAEYKFNDAEKIKRDMLGKLTDTEKKYFKDVILSLQKDMGKEVTDKKYFPVINLENLNKKITFGGSGKLENTYQDSEMVFNDLNDNFSVNNPSSFDFQEGSDAFGFQDGLDTFAREETDNPAVLLSRRPQIDFTRRPYFLIIDHDVGKDGSIRNITPLQSIGSIRRGLEQVVSNTLAQPTFENKRISFVNRTYLGTATFGKTQMRDENEPLYNRLRRLAKKLKQSTVTDEQYQYAMALLNFKWLPQEEDEAENILKKLAETSYPKAQFEYGYKLYREQRNITEAVHWISMASKYGLTKAEYLLARILHSSPWIINDEKKALFWYKSAMKKGHEAATLKVIELKLLAIDKTLHNVPEAIELLANVDELYSENPEYNFLLSISHKNRENRNFRHVVKYLNKAIDLGEDLNWDVAYWQELMSRWTTGSVHIVD